MFDQKMGRTKVIQICQNNFLFLFFKFFQFTTQLFHRNSIKIIALKHKYFIHHKCSADAEHYRDGTRSGRPAGQVTRRVEILRPAGQTG